LPGNDFFQKRQHQSNELGKVQFPFAGKVSGLHPVIFGISGSLAKEIPQILHYFLVYFIFCVFDD